MEAITISPSLSKKAWYKTKPDTVERHSNTKSLGLEVLFLITSSTNYRDVEIQIFLKLLKSSISVLGYETDDSVRKRNAPGTYMFF